MKRILAIATLGLVVLISWRLSNAYYAVFSLVLIVPLLPYTRESVLISRRRLAHVIMPVLAIIPLACFWLLAAHSHPGWGLVASLVLISWVVTRQDNLARKEAKETLRAKFSNTDPLILDFEIESIYGHPQFMVVFRSEADLEKAKGGSLCQQVQIEVERLVKDPLLGGVRSSFDPRLGIHYTTTAGGIATRGCGLYYWTSIGGDDSVRVSCHLSSRCGGVTGNGGVSSTQQALAT